MAVSKDKTGVLVNMDKVLKEKLSVLAKKQNRSLSNLIVTVLQNYVEDADK
nr:DNA-binding protein [uncultured Blautia sp.]